MLFGAREEKRDFGVNGASKRFVSFIAFSVFAYKCALSLYHINLIKNKNMPNM